jgi:hypothetical protein
MTWRTIASSECDSSRFHATTETDDSALQLLDAIALTLDVRRAPLQQCRTGPG